MLSVRIQGDDVCFSLLFCFCCRRQNGLALALVGFVADDAYGESGNGLQTVVRTAVVHHQDVRMHGERAFNNLAQGCSVVVNGNGYEYVRFMHTGSFHRARFFQVVEPGIRAGYPDVFLCSRSGAGR